MDSDDIAHCGALFAFVILLSLPLVFFLFFFIVIRPFLHFLNNAPSFAAPCRMSGVFPDTVLRNEHELKVLKVDDSVNTTFVCEVRNQIGIGRDQITPIVRGESEPRKRPTRAPTTPHSA